MKKLLSIILALAVFAGTADAQISIKKSPIDRAEKMITISPYWIWIYRDVDTYLLAIKSSNDFDNSYWLQLGKTKEECERSVSDLITLAKTIGKTDRYDINNGVGDVYQVTQYKMLGATGLTFSGEGYAGFGYVTVSSLKSSLEWIQEKVK